VARGRAYERGVVLGDNDAEVPLSDERAGDCSDGLTSAGRSRNQGAESTLAMIAVLQQGHRMAAPRGHELKTTRTTRRIQPAQRGLLPTGAQLRAWSSWRMVP
jgi:hypothetical protein